MQPEPVLRWPNAVRGTPEGATFVWTLDGRPEAIACIWTRRSMSALEAKLDGESVWSVPRSIGAPDQPWFHGSVTNGQ